MTLNAKRALVAFGVLILAAIAILSFGPSVDVRPSNSPFDVNDGATAEQRLVSPTDMGDMNMQTLPVFNFSLPEFQGITHWWNTANNEPLTPEDLRGKVVLVDFWTYSCINCIRTFPFMREMHEKYGNNGLVIIGVHTPEFAFEANPDNVSREIEKNNLNYPVALDPDYKTWRAYSNRYWPAGYFFDHMGRLRRTHFGEGEYQESEEAIRSLLREAGYELDEMGMTDATTPDFSKIKTHETYFGLLRGREFTQSAGSRGEATAYSNAKTPTADRWNVEGTWTFEDEYVVAHSDDAKFFFNVQASKMHLVLESEDGAPKLIEIFVDGEKTRDITVQDAELYDIAEFPDAARHHVEIRIQDAGVRFFAATFS